MKIEINDSSHLESPDVAITQVESDCALFHYDRPNGWLVTCKSTTQEMSVRQIDQSTQMIRSLDPHPQAQSKRRGSSVIWNTGLLTLEIIQREGDYQCRDADLMKVLSDELDQRSKFPPHLRLAIYKRMLIQSKQQEDELTATFYQYLARPSPEIFLKKFRAAWKLEEAGFQFSLETLLSIFHGMGKFSESALIDKLAPIIYSFLKILESAEEISKLDSGEESIELVETYKVSWLMLDRFGEGAFGEKGNNQSERKKNYEVFVQKVTQRLSQRGGSSIGNSLLSHLAYHLVSIGKECLPHLTHGFLMGFCSPGSFESLMDHLVIGHSGLTCMVEICGRLLEYFGEEIMGLSTRTDILNFFDLTHHVDMQGIKNLS